MTPRHKKSTRLPRLCRAAAALALVVPVFLAIPADGKGIVRIGGEPAVGVSAYELIRMADSISRPVPPLDSILLDETYQSLIPVDSGVSLVTWEEAGADLIRLTLSSNAVWGDAPTRVIAPDDLIRCWETRSSERWDAGWALRGIVGVEDLSNGIEGLRAVDERTLELRLRPGAGPNAVRKALASPALRLSNPPDAQNPDGTGPFLLEQPSSSRNRLTCALTHFAGRAYLDEVSVIAYPSADESVLDFGRGSLDALLITSNERSRFAESSRAVDSRTETIGEGLLVLVFNPARLPDASGRRAFSLAVDRESIARVVLGEGADVAADFLGSPASAGDWESTLEEARRLLSSVHMLEDSHVDATTGLVLLVADDPAARAASGRLRANWESLGVPVEIRNQVGPLAVSMEADAMLLSFRVPRNGEGALPQCLALYDRGGWWEIIALAMPPDAASLLRSVRALDPGADLGALGSALQSASLVVPVTRYEILFAPGPDISLVPSAVYPGTTFWRAFMGRLPETLENQSNNGQDD